MTDAQWVEHSANQVVEVSRLAIIKHKRIRWATMSTLARHALAGSPGDYGP